MKKKRKEEEKRVKDGFSLMEICFCAFKCDENRLWELIEQIEVLLPHPVRLTEVQYHKFRWTYSSEDNDGGGGNGGASNKF